MKPPTQVRDSYNHAQKMRAAMTYAFGRLCGLGSLPWHESEVSGRMVGNPSVSETVGTYMTSLQRLMITPRNPQLIHLCFFIMQETLRRLYDFNNRPDIVTVKEYSAGSRGGVKNEHDWGGARARRLLTLAYVLSFLCLLRFDEVLKIQMHDIEWVSDTCIKLSLPFRKTNQFGGMKPFYLYLLLPHLAHLCPIHTLAEWLMVSGITYGYLFRKMASGDRRSDSFLEMFRQNLLDIKIDPYPTEFSNLTIVKYLISYVDDPSERCEEYMNPDRAPLLKCYTCGRSCHCI
ncbi:DNA breaking-rejoining enzyme [Mycena maculata]|uniref:DNA breaking-rejoining enzyme n=1 Tax=Mycena maculata TaxID=230809 RepID=A0AAD7NLH6_9AGAR|nr:DNA breaking-rejoining enzyme [Mycena maculata]